MNLLLRSRTSWLLLLALMSGCPSVEPGPGPEDAGQDAGVESGEDPGPVDAGHRDAGTDGGTDAGVDAGEVPCSREKTVHTAPLALLDALRLELSLETDPARRTEKLAAFWADVEAQ